MVHSLNRLIPKATLAISKLSPQKVHRVTNALTHTANLLTNEEKALIICWVSNRISIEKYQVKAHNKVGNLLSLIGFIGV